MAKYNCPIETCNVTFNGGIHEIAPRAIGHGYGSHQLRYSEEDVFKIIQEQADEKARVENNPVDLKKWWKRINEV